jgi:hypothetical protein
MAVKLQCRPELLRGWFADLAAKGSSGQAGRSLVLDPGELRRIAEDALAAHEMYKPLAELVQCKALKARFEPMQPGPDRAVLVQEYMDRVGPAWDAAFKVLGVRGYHGGAAAVPLPAPATRGAEDHANNEVTNG